MTMTAITDAIFSLDISIPLGFPECECGCNFFATIFFFEFKNAILTKVNHWTCLGDLVLVVFAGFVSFIVNAHHHSTYVGR